MNIVTTRFGLIQVQESDLFRIPDGLVGFRAFTQFALLPDPVTAGLTWLQSATAPGPGLRADRATPGGQRLPRRAPGGRPGGGTELDEGGSSLTYVILNRAARGRPHGQPPGATGVQPGPAARPPTRVDLQPVRGPVPPDRPRSGRQPHPAAGTVGAPSDGLIGMVCDTLTPHPEPRRRFLPTRGPGAD